MGASSGRFPRWWLPLLLAVPVVLVANSKVELVDDAYITARYARNLAEGNGLVFNLGEHVEGMTNLLWTLVLALVAKLGFALDDAAFEIGIACGLLAMLVGGRIARSLGASAGATAAAMLLMGVNHHYWLTVGNGLEAGMFSLLLSATVESALATRRPLLTGVLAGLTFLTRPESASMAVLVALFIGLADTPATATMRMPRLRDPALRRMAEMVLAFALLAGAATVFRWLYYHAIVPNSVTAKSVPLDDPAVLWPNLQSGVRYLLRFVRDVFPIALGVLCALAVVRRRPLVLLLAVVASEVPPVLINGGDWVRHSRLLIVYAPLLVALCARGVDGLYAHAARGERRRTLALAGLTLIAGVAALALVTNREWSEVPQLRPALPGILECYRGVGERLAHVLVAGDVVATEAIGLIGYELPAVYVHDPMGLTDRYVARHGRYLPRIGRVDYAYTYQHVHPGIVLLHQDDMSMPAFAGASAGRFDREYHAYYVDQGQPCSYYEKDGRDIHLMIAVRNDLAARVEPALRELPLRPFGPTASLTH